MENIFWGGLQAVLVLALAPLINGIIKKIKAWFQCRRGFSIWQPYFDLLKLFRKDAVVSEHTSWVFKATPYITFTAMATITFLLPVVTTQVPLNFVGDIILIVYLLALARFFMALAGLDAGSAFGGMGSSREMAISSIAEPAMMLAIFTVVLTYGSTNLSYIVQSAYSETAILLSPGHFLALVAFFIVALTETGRIPIDNPDTHLELTMIHEGMILEYSGKYLALMNWAASIKQLVIFTLLANIFLPWGITANPSLTTFGLAFLIYLLKILVLALAVSFIESSFAKMRLFRVPELLGASFILSLLALISVYVVRGS